MTLLSELLSLIRKLIDIIKSVLRREEEEEEEEYTREDFEEAVKKLSEEPKWRARILKDALTVLRKRYEGVHTEWIDKDRLTTQTIHRNLSCGITLSYGDGIYAIPKEAALDLFRTLQQDAIKYIAEHMDCDNFAVIFKGLGDYVFGKPVVIFTTGLVLRVIEQLGHRTCICKADYLVGGHGWNRMAILEPIEYQKVGSTETIIDNFTLINYEPQSDVFSTDSFMSDDVCYKSGGGLPIFYGFRR